MYNEINTKTTKEQSISCKNTIETSVMAER